jgi:hypothetical protein
MRSYNFWRLMFNKVTSRSYGYFKILWLLPQVLILFLGQKLQKLVKKTEGILGAYILKIARKNLEKSQKLILCKHP